MKTPEEMAEEYCLEIYGYKAKYRQKDFLAGYQAAKNTYKDAIETYEDVAKQMLQEAVRIMSPKDQFADTGKVMNFSEKPDSCEHILDMDKMVDVNCSSGWISVYERMPEKNKKVKVLINYFLEGTQIRQVTKAFFRNGLWSGDGVHITHPLVSHWMPLPEAPKEEK